MNNVVVYPVEVSVRVLLKTYVAVDANKEPTTNQLEAIAKQQVLEMIDKGQLELPADYYPDESDIEYISIDDEGAWNENDFEEEE